MISLIHTTDSIKVFGISFSLLNFVNDYSSLMEYLFKKDIASKYLEIGKKFHGNMSGEHVKLNIDYQDYKNDKSVVFLSPHSVSHTYLMYYTVHRDLKYNEISHGDLIYEQRAKAYIFYRGYKLCIRSVFDVINIDKKMIIELKTASFYKYTSVEERNYDMQAYIYWIMSNGLHDIEKICFVFVTTIYPFKTFVRYLSKKELESGKIKFYHKLDLVIDLIETHKLNHLFEIKSD